MHLYIDQDLELFYIALTQSLLYRRAAYSRSSIVIQKNVTQLKFSLDEKHTHKTLITERLLVCLLSK